MGADCSASSSGCHPTGWLPSGGQRRAQHALCHEDLTPGLPCECGPSHSPGSTGQSSFVLIPWKQPCIVQLERAVRAQACWGGGGREEISSLSFGVATLTLAPLPGRGMSCWLLSLSLSRRNGSRCCRSPGRCKCLSVCQQGL